MNWMAFWFFVILAAALSPLLLMWILTRNVPLGYEDETGFHEGSDHPVQSLGDDFCRGCGARLPVGWVCYCEVCIKDNFPPTAFNAVEDSGRLDEYRGGPGLTWAFPECSSQRVKRSQSTLP